MTRPTSTCMLLLASLSIASGSVTELPAQAADGINALRSAFTHSLEQQDIEASIALFTPDAIFLTPEGGRYNDRAAIRTLYRSVVAKYSARLSMTSQRQEQAGNLCVDEGTYSETLTETATGKPLALTGSYILIAKRRSDGAWKIAEMVWTGGPH